MVGHSGDTTNGILDVIQQTVHSRCGLIEVVHRRTDVLQCHDECLYRTTTLFGQFDALGYRVDCAQYGQEVVHQFLEVELRRRNVVHAKPSRWTVVTHSTVVVARERLEWFARTHQVTIAVRGIDSSYRRKVATRP